MRPIELGREERLRAACDRCHELKNRCVRAGGPDSRCSRCERLDIDCVYRNVNRMGRPRTRARPVPTPAQPLQSPESSDRDSEGFQQQQPGLMADDISSHGKMSMGSTMPSTPNRTSNDREAAIAREWQPFEESPPEIMDLLTLAECADSHAEMDWNLSSVDLSLHKSAGHEALHAMPPLEGIPAPNTAPASSNTRSMTPDHTSLSTATSTSEASMTLDKLSSLQRQLHRLLHKSSEEGIAGDIDEGLQAAKSFLELLQAYYRCLCPIGLSNFHSSHGDRDQTNTMPSLPLNSIHPNHRQSLTLIVILQAMTCYSYLLEVLDRVIDSLRGQSNVPLPVSLGVFNLASQPELNQDVIFHIMLSMVQKVRLLIHGQGTDGCKKSHLSSFDSGGGGDSVPHHCQSANPVAISLPGMAELVQERERTLVEKLTGLARIT